MLINKIILFLCICFIFILYTEESKTWNVIKAILITAAVLLVLGLVVLCVVKRQRISSKNVQ